MTKVNIENIKWDELHDACFILSLQLENMNKLYGTNYELESVHEGDGTTDRTFITVRGKLPKRVVKEFLFNCLDAENLTSRSGIRDLCSVDCYMSVGETDEGVVTYIYPEHNISSFKHKFQ